MAVPMGSFAEAVLFGGFRRLVASFRVAGMAFRNIQTCSGMYRKSFSRARRNTFVIFSENVLQFSSQVQLDASIVIFRGRRSTLDASCYAPRFINRIGKIASGNHKVQIPWQVGHFIICTKN